MFLHNFNTKWRTSKIHKRALVIPESCTCILITKNQTRSCSCSEHYVSVISIFSKLVCSLLKIFYFWGHFSKSCIFKLTFMWLCWCKQLISLSRQNLYEVMLACDRVWCMLLKFHQLFGFHFNVYYHRYWFNN